MAREVIVSAVLFRAVRDGARVLRSAGWRALVLAALYFVFLPVALVAPEALALASPVVFTVENLITFGLARVLGAHRGVLPERPPPPPGDPGYATRAVAATAAVPPVSRADRAPAYALRQAGRLGRAALRLALVQLLVVYAGILAFMLVSGGRFQSIQDPSTGDELLAFVGLAPLIALFGAFVALAAQRIALEGDDRVLVAVSHSVRIARTRYLTLLTLVLAESLLHLPVVLSGDDGVVVAAAFTAGVLFRLLTVATSNELYVDGPRLDVTDDFGRRVRG